MVFEELVDCENENRVKEYLSEKEQLNLFLMHEESYWKQWAKLFWLKEGDENTRYFHAPATAKKKANRIDFFIKCRGWTS